MGHWMPRGKKSFLLVVENGYNTKGKRDRKTKTIKIEDPKILNSTRKREKYLNQQLLMFEMEVTSGEYISPEKSTFESFANEYKDRILYKKFAHRTSEMHESHIKNYIVPSIGHRRLDQIKTMHIVDFMDSLEKDGIRKDGKAGGLSSSTRYDIFKVLKAMFKVAVKQWKLIKSDPTEDLDPPTVETKEMQFYDSEAAKECIEALYQIDIMWRLYFLGAMIGGLRRAEGLAFEWHLDVDWDAGGFYVNRSIPKTIDGKPLIKDPKSKKSKRFVKMPDWYMDELEEYYRMWKKEKLRLGNAWEGGEHQYVFHSGNGKPYYYTTPTAKWSKFTKKYGLKKIRLHELRHTMVTLLIEAGANYRAIQERVGHASYRTTFDRYGHVTKKLTDETAELFNNFDPKKRYRQ
ncbi:site-specific integrase [Bacillus sp. B38]|uniref:tyrosine-type recombinase/integrase n=1 Tax=Bacillus sp. B38 TaxID=218305 RepID=UPI003C7E3349